MYKRIAVIEQDELLKSLWDYCQLGANIGHEAVGQDQDDQKEAVAKTSIAAIEASLLWSNDILEFLPNLSPVKEQLLIDILYKLYHPDSSGVDRQTKCNWFFGHMIEVMTQGEFDSIWTCQNLDLSHISYILKQLATF